MKEWLEANTVMKKQCSCAEFVLEQGISPKTAQIMLDLIQPHEQNVGESFYTVILCCKGRIWDQSLAK